MASKAIKDEQVDARPWQDRLTTLDGRPMREVSTNTFRFTHVIPPVKRVAAA